MFVSYCIHQHKAVLNVLEKYPVVVLCGYWKIYRINVVLAAEAYDFYT
jgi:hypothetical protein